MKVTRLLALLMAMLMVFPFVVFAEYEPETIIETYVSSFVCACGEVSFTSVDSWETPKMGYDAGACWRKRYYWDISCTSCGRFYNDYLVRQDKQPHLMEDFNGDGIHDCLFCEYSY